MGMFGVIENRETDQPKGLGLFSSILSGRRGGPSWNVHLCPE